MSSKAQRTRIDFRSQARTRRGRAWDRVQLGLAYLLAGGWAARLARSLGLQGRVTTSTHTIEIDGLRERSLRVAFASDFHAGATTHPELHRQACTALLAMEPDIILLGGDFIAFEAKEVEPLLPLLAELRAPLGVFAVLGNHDYSSDTDRIVAGLEQSGITVLRNRVVPLGAPDDEIWLSGLDDPTYGRAHADGAFAATSGARLVLMHAPDGLLEIGERHFDIAFCGHTHGGQIALPGGRALIMPIGRLNRRFGRGVFRLKSGARLLVSRGIGCSTLPFRLFSRPEVHLCHLVPTAATTKTQPGFQDSLDGAAT